MLKITKNILPLIKFNKIIKLHESNDKANYFINNKQAIEEDIYMYCEDTLSDFDINIDEIWLHGSRIRGDYRDDSDLDAVMFYYGNEREDTLFNILNEDRLVIDGIEVDINPIRIEDEEDKNYYKSESNAYDKEKLSQLKEDKHDTLNKKLWDSNNQLLPEIKEKLLFIINKFSAILKEDGIELNIKDVLLLGSNANYNYTSNSDLDLHIIADLSEYKGREKELAMKLYDCQRRLFNNKYDPELRGIEVELYVEPYTELSYGGLNEAILSPEIANDAFNLGLDLSDTKKYKFDDQAENEKYFAIKAQNWLLLFKPSIGFYNSKVKPIEQDFYDWVNNLIEDNARIAKFFEEYLYVHGISVVPLDFCTANVKWHEDILTAQLETDWDLFITYKETRKAIKIIKTL